jgi:hypothetical protein
LFSSGPPPPAPVMVCKVNSNNELANTELLFLQEILD